MGVVLLTSTVQQNRAAIRCDRWAAAGFPLGRGLSPTFGRTTSIERHQLLRDRYPADGVSQLGRSNQWLIPSLQLKIEIAAYTAPCPPHYRHQMTLQSGAAGAAQTGDLNYFRWTLRPSGAPSPHLQVSSFNSPVWPVSHYLSPVSSAKRFYCSLSGSTVFALSFSLSQGHLC